MDAKTIKYNRHAMVLDIEYAANGDDALNLVEYFNHKDEGTLKKRFAGRVTEFVMSDGNDAAEFFMNKLKAGEIDTQDLMSYAVQGFMAPLKQTDNSLAAFAAMMGRGQGED